MEPAMRGGSQIEQVREVGKTGMGTTLDSLPDGSRTQRHTVRIYRPPSCSAFVDPDIGSSRARALELPRVANLLAH